MKRNKVRNWIYAILKLLPLLVLPILAIYTHRHQSTDYQVEVSQNEIVDFNQDIGYQYFAPDSLSDDVLITWDTYNVDITLNTLSSSVYPRIFKYTPLNVGHVYYFRARNIQSSGVQISSVIGARYFNSESFNPVSYFAPFGLITPSYPYFDMYVNGLASSTPFSISFYFNIIDLTQMFGSGNEPTVEQFNSWYPYDYYDYTLSRKELLKDLSILTYNNTDVGSQLMYSLYIPINDYFNFKNYFGLNGVYDFMQLNMFNGNAPMPFFIAFNIIAYNLFIDLLLLVYSAFMFVIDFAFKCLDKFYGRSEK